MGILDMASSLGIVSQRKAEALRLDLVNGSQLYSHGPPEHAPWGLWVVAEASVTWTCYAPEVPVQPERNPAEGPQGHCKDG